MSNRSKRYGLFVMHIRYANSVLFKRVENMNNSTTLQTKNMTDTFFLQDLS
jgi:hypothetical protein